MVAEKITLCPECGQLDLVFKVRLIYLESLEKLREGDSAKTPELDRFLKESGYEGKPPKEIKPVLQDLVKQFAPPSGKPQLLKTISPDMVMIVFGAISIFFLYQIFVTQRPIFGLMAAIFVVFYASYIVFHKKLMARFEAQKKMDTGSVEVIQKAIGKWMKASYCLRDSIIFGVNKDETAPLGEMIRYLIAHSLPDKG